MRHSWLAMVVGLAACSGAAATPVDPSASANASGRLVVGRATPGVYVLSRYDTQTSSPFIYADLACPSAHYQSLILADTIELSADGSARRAFAVGQTVNGIGGTPDYTEWSGTWQTFDATNWYYFGGSTSISLRGSIRGTPVSGYYRVDSPTTLTTPMGTGGSCDRVTTSTAAPREVTAVYTRI